MKTFLKDNAVLIAVGTLLCAYHVVLVRQWTETETQPPGWDQSVHLSTAHDYLQAVTSLSPLRMVHPDVKASHAPYPPLYHYSLLTVLGADRPHVAVAWLNLAFLWVLLFASGWMAFRLGGPVAAAAVAIVLGTSPLLLHFSFEVLTDLPLAAFVALGYAFLLESELFEKRRPSIWFGVCALLALLAKWTALTYLAPAIAAGLWTAGRRKNLRSALAIAALCAPWYLINMVSILPRIWRAANLGQGEGDPVGWNLANLWFYPGWVVNNFSLPCALLLAAGASWAIWKRSPTPGPRPRLVLAAWLAVSYVFWSCVPNKDARYFLPALAAVPVVALPGAPLPLMILASGAAIYHSQTIAKPQRQSWKDREIVAALKDFPAPFTLCVLANHRYLNSTALKWQAQHAGVTGMAVGCRESEIPEWTDLVLLKTGDPGIFLADRTRQILSQAADKRGLFPQVFHEVKRWPLPDRSDAVLYERRSDVPPIAEALHYDRLEVKGAVLYNVWLSPRSRTRYEVHASSAVLSKLSAPIRKLHVSLEGARLFKGEEPESAVYVLGIATITFLSAELDWTALAQALSARSGLPISIEARDGDVVMTTRLGPIPLTLAFAAKAAGESVDITIKTLRFAGLPLNLGQEFTWKQALSPRPPGQPFQIRLKPIDFLAEHARVGKSS